MDALLHAATNSEVTTRHHTQKEGNRYAHHSTLFSKEHLNYVQTAKIAVVGAGGIGCELLKNLVMTGFRSIEVIDLDTIDVSNLNRQFLFRRHHVGSSKAETAKGAVLEFNPDVSIKAYHGNVKETRFGPDYIKQFDLVLNALDNVSARRHVNRLCLSEGVPLIESGTQGYMGQVGVIIKGKTECYECVTPETPKTFAVCTIRDTPDKPVHCIAWAKLMYDVLFGPKDDENMLHDLKLEQEASETNNSFARRMFNQLFHDGIKDRIERKMSGREDGEEEGKDGEESKSTSSSASPPASSASAASAMDTSPDGAAAAAATSSSSSSSVWGPNGPPNMIALDSVLVDGAADGVQKMDLNASGVAGSAQQQEVLSLADTAKSFLTAVLSVLETPGKFGQTTFDKDDPIAMSFVSAAANLRMENYHIARLSPFAVKGIAGNIVHAIATTNAVCAGLIVLEALKVIFKRPEECRKCWIRPFAPKPVNSQSLDPPAKGCWVCQRNKVNLTCNIRKFTVKELFSEVLTKRLGMINPSIAVGDNLITADLDEWDDRVEWRDNFFKNPLTHEAVGVRHASLITADDQDQAFTVDLRIIDCPNFTPDEGSDDLFELVGEASAKAESARPVGSQPSAATGSSSTTDADGRVIIDDDDIEIVGADAMVDDAATPTASSSGAANGASSTNARKKRKSSEPLEDVAVVKPSAKKGKAEAAS